MKKIKVNFINRKLNRDDYLRGIGVHTKCLLEALRKIPELDIKLSRNPENGFDIYHFPKFNPYFVDIPLIKKGKIVLTIHDLIPLIYPDKYPSGIRGRIKYIANKCLVKRADAIITISETSKKDIARILKIHPKKIFVTYLAARQIFRKIEDKEKLESVSKKYKLPDKFVLYVGDVNYNKNLSLLARACKNNKIALVIVGKQASLSDIKKDNVENKPFINFLKKYGEDKNIIRLGYVDDNDLVCIYNLAKVYSQPSLYEGFGLPIIEALACGVPVVASKIQTHVEIFKDSVLYANTKDYLDLSKKIRKVIEDENVRIELIKKGLKRAKNLSWKKTAVETYKVYKSLL